jgi:hypothetical protein
MCFWTCSSSARQEAKSRLERSASRSTGSSGGSEGLGEDDGGMLSDCTLTLLVSSSLPFDVDLFFRGGIGLRCRCCDASASCAESGGE